MISRRLFLQSGAAAVALATTIGFAQASEPAGEPVYLGVSGPLTGPNAQYGAQWKQGFDLALDQINGSGGVKGRPLRYIFEDTQSDPKQTVAVAQKFVADKRIVAELGDFASPASMAASPIYQRAGLVQFGLTNSHPDFTKTGDFIWSNSVSQADEQPLNAAFAVKRLGFRRIAVLHLNTDWGRTSKDHLVTALRAAGHRDARPLDGLAALPGVIAGLAKPGDIVVCLGAGNITQWAYALPKQLAALSEEK